MKSLWFIVPARGRVQLTGVCLRQLALTCAELQQRGLAASAVVIADDQNLATAKSLGFQTVEQANEPFGRKWNDGYELAGRSGIDYVVPLGTDDWVDHRLISFRLPAKNTIRCSRFSSVVREDGRKLTRIHVPYNGGDGVRTIPTAMLKPLAYRPVEDSRTRAIDTSLMREVSKLLGRTPTISYVDLDPLQIVDWKSHGQQLNSYKACQDYQQGCELDPWDALAGRYPAESLAEMRGVYGLPAEMVMKA